MTSGFGVEASGSGASEAPASTPAASFSPTVHRPTTRLQHGISKPKVYTDGTVRWGMLSTTSTEEPAIVSEALQD